MVRTCVLIAAGLAAGVGPLARGGGPVVSHVWACLDAEPWQNPLCWSRMAVPFDAGHVAFFPGGGTSLIQDDAAVGQLWLDFGNFIEIESGWTLNILDGVIISDGSRITVNTFGADQPTQLIFFGGTGEFYDNAGSFPFGQIALNAASNDSLGSALVSGLSLMEGPVEVFGAGRVQSTGLVNNAVNDGAFLTGGIYANMDGRVLRLAADTTNNSLIAAIDGGILEIDGDINQAGGGSITGEDGCVIRVLGEVITAGVVDVEPGGVVEFLTDGGAVPRLEGGLVFTGPSVVLNQQVLDVATITHNGEMMIGEGDGPACCTTLNLLGGNVVGGLGTFALNAPDEGSLAGTRVRVGDNVELGPGQAISGTGDVSQQTAGATLILDGSIVADVIGRTMRVGLLTIESNGGAIRAQDGGVLRLGFGSDAIVTQTGGAVIEAVDGGEVVMESGGTITGGSLKGETGVVRVVGVPRLDGVTVSGVIEVEESAQLRMLSGVTINGSVLVNPAGGAGTAQASVNLSGAGVCTIDGAGEWVLSAESDGNIDSAIFNADNDHIVLGAGQVVRGTGWVRGSGGPMNLTNNGQVWADVAGRTLEYGMNTSANHGTIGATGGGTMRVTSLLDLDNTDGQIVADDSEVEFLAGGDIIGGVLQASGAGGRFVLTGTRRFAESPTLEGPLDVFAGAEMQVGEITTNIGTITNNGVITVNAGGSTTNTRLRMFGDPTVLDGAGEVVLNAAVDPIDAHIMGFTNGVPVENGVDHTISGTGLLNAMFVNRGRLAPGLPIGTLSHSGPSGGTFTQDASGVLEIEFTGTPGGGPEHDVMAFLSGAATLGGALDLVFVDGFVPGDGVEYTVATGQGSGVMSGAFDSVQAPAGFGAEVVYAPTAVTVSFTKVDCPADLSGDGVVNSSDLNMVLANFGCAGGGCSGDVDGDGDTDSADLNLLLAAFGDVCAP